jgi:prevent-host-death family protein
MGLSLKNVIPMTSFKRNTSEYIQKLQDEVVTNEDDKAIALTVNGVPVVVVQTAEDFEEMAAKARESKALRQELDELHQSVTLLAELDRRMKDYDESKTLTSDDIRKKLFKK